MSDQVPARSRLAGHGVLTKRTLRHLLEANDLTAADLSRLLGCDRSLGVRILNGERQLTVNHIQTLANHFGLPSQAFLP